MIELGGEKIGHPWHGLYRADIEKIVTPAGGNIDPPGEVPFNGDCYLVQIPGLPEPETTPGEAASGQTWLNYALVSDGRVYGKNIGGPLYIDAAGRAWRLTIWLGGSRTSQTITATVQATRFGEVGSGAATVVTRPEMSVAFNLHPDYPVYASETSGAVLLDVAKNGSKFLVGIRRLRGFSAVAEVTLSGSPADGSFYSSMALLADEAAVDIWPAVNDHVGGVQFVSALHRTFDWSAGPIQTDSGIYPTAPGFYNALGGGVFAFNGTSYATHAWYQRQLLTSTPPLAGDFDDGAISTIGLAADESAWSVTWLCGARYDAGWDAVLATSDIESRVTYAPAYPVGNDPQYLPVLGYTFVNPMLIEDVEQVIRAEVNIGADVTASEQRINTEVSQLGAGSYEVVSTLTRAGTEIKTVINSRSSAWYQNRWGLLAPPGSVLSSGVTMGAERRSNSVYLPAMLLVELGPETGLGSGDARYSTSTRLRGDLMGRLGTAAQDSAKAYASEHPVTGEIAQGSNVVCWV